MWKMLRRRTTCMWLVLSLTLLSTLSHMYRNGEGIDKEGQPLRVREGKPAEEQECWVDAQTAAYIMANNKDGMIRPTENSIIDALYKATALINDHIHSAEIPHHTEMLAAVWKQRDLDVSTLEADPGGVGQGERCWLDKAEVESILHLGAEPSFTPIDSLPNCALLPLYRAARLLQAEFRHARVKLLGGQLRVLRGKDHPEEPRRETCDGCNVYRYRRLVTPSVCQEEGDIDLLVVVTTIAGTPERRRVVRDTWGAAAAAAAGGRVRCVFLVGAGLTPSHQRQVYKEHKLYGDLLQDDFIDNYYNLSYKVMMAYTWAHQECSRARFVFRAADDVYINIPAMLDLVTLNPAPLDRALVGKVVSRMVTNRDRRFKWYLSYNEYPQKLLPDFCKGTAFMASMQTVGKIIRGGENTPYFSLEDVWFGMVAINTDMQLFNIETFYSIFTSDMNNKLKEDKCPFKEGFHAAHSFTPREMSHMYKACNKKPLR